jgi:hypothetical protein
VFCPPDDPLDPWDPLCELELPAYESVVDEWELVVELPALFVVGVALEHAAAAPSAAAPKAARVKTPRNARWWLLKRSEGIGSSVNREGGYWMRQ